MYTLLKYLLTAGIITLVAELAKTSPTAGAFIKSLPLVSLLAFIWIYLDTRDVSTIASLSYSTFWLVLPTLPFFLLLPWLLARWAFWPSLGIGLLCLLLCYALAGWLLPRLGVSL
jgi:hypothetical protein